MRKRIVRGSWIALAGLAAWALVRVIETRRPLRRATQPRAPRERRNLAIAVTGGLALVLAQSRTVLPLTRLVARRRWGLALSLGLPAAAETALAVVLLDATQTLWHCLTHRVPLLWRFHEAHHSDLDMDALTGFRFHFGELLLAVPFRAAQVVLLGVTPQALSWWQAVTTAHIAFHHSNVRLPERFERALTGVIVTPRMHGIHHSTRDDEQSSNWGTIFSFFDRLAGTFRLDVPADRIVIGLADRQDPQALTLPDVLAMPFQR